MTDQTPGRAPEAMQGQPQDAGQGSGQPDHDWEWRRKIRANPHSHRIYKWVVGVVGVLVVAVGIVLLPAPGPGWVIIFVGIGILASEFEKAQRLLDWAKARVSSWNDWQKTPWWVRALLGLGTLLLVLLIFWALFAVSGVPGFLPGFLKNTLAVMPGL